MRRTSYLFPVICLLTLLHAGLAAKGQRITFGTWAGSDIVIRPFTVNTLEFGNLVRGGGVKTVELSGAVAFEVTAPDGYEVTVTLDAPSSLTGPNSKTIPLNLKFAYSNQGAADVVSARNSALEVTSGFHALTFPVRRSGAAIPAPPPTPADGSSAPRSTATAYLFFYGSVGPAGVSADSGNYTGEVNIYVEYTSY